MANTLGLTEVTVAQLADCTHEVNSGSDWYRKRVVRVTDHTSNMTAEVGSNYEKMAIFECKGKGFPWERRGTKLACKTVVSPDVSGMTTANAAAALAAVAKDFEVLYPNWDFSTFQ